ncbi:MAG: hypothetical protein ACRDL3_15545 [Solirubrobacterales bacterium]
MTFFLLIALVVMPGPATAVPVTTATSARTPTMIAGDRREAVILSI